MGWGKDKLNDINTLVNANITNILEPLYQALSKDIGCITDVYINPDERTFITFSDMRTEEIKTPLSPQSIHLLGSLLATSSSSSLSFEHPFVSSSFEWENSNVRFEILIPPVVQKASLSLRFHTLSSPSVDELIKIGMLSIKNASLLQKLVREKKNIVISGETGSGKTTLLNALLNTIDPKERLVIVEDGINEITHNLPNAVSLTTIDNAFSSLDAIHSALRMNPDRIIYGEIRNYDSASETLKAWRTGHSGGLSTIHATSARDITLRLFDILSEKNTSEKMHIDESIDVKVHCAIENDKRIVKEIIYDKN